MELNKKYLDQAGLAELIQTIAQISYNLSDTDELLSTHITHVTDLLFGKDYNGTFPDDEADTKAKPLVGSVEKILDYLGLSEDSEEGESVKAQLERIFATLGDGVGRDNTVSDNIDRIDSVIGEGFSADSTVADQLAAEVARAKEAETVLTDALGTFEDGSGFNTLVSTTADGVETRTETVADHITKIEEYVGLNDDDRSDKSLQEQINDIEDELGFKGYEFGGENPKTVKDYIDKKDEAIEDELGFKDELGGEGQAKTVKGYIDKNRDEVEKELGFKDALGGEGQPETVKDYVDTEVAKASDKVTDYVDSVLGYEDKENKTPFFKSTEGDTVKDVIEKVERYSKDNFILDVRAGDLKDGIIPITFFRKKYDANETEGQTIDLNLTDLTKDSFLKGSYKLQIETYENYKKLAGESADAEVVVDDNLKVAFDPDTYKIYAVQNATEGYPLAWPQKEGSYNPTDVFLVFEFTREESDVTGEDIKDTIWINVSDLVKSYDFDAVLKGEYPDNNTDIYSNYTVGEYFDFKWSKDDIDVKDGDSHKTRKNVVYTLTVKEKFAQYMKQIDDTKLELEKVEGWLGYSGAEDDSILNRLTEAESEIDGLKDLEFNTEYTVEPKAGDEAAIAVKKYVDDSVADEASKREELEALVGKNDDYSKAKDHTVIDHIEANKADIKALNDYTGLGSTYYSTEDEKFVEVELPHTGESISNGRTVKTIVDSVTCVDEELHEFVDLVGKIETLEHFGKAPAADGEHEVPEGAKTLVDCVNWNTKEIHDLQKDLGKSDEAIADLQDQIGEGFDKDNSISDKIADLQKQIGDDFKEKSVSEKIGEVDERIDGVDKKIEELKDAIDDAAIDILGVWIGPEVDKEKVNISVRGAFKWYFDDREIGDLLGKDFDVAGSTEIGPQ